MILSNVLAGDSHLGGRGQSWLFRRSRSKPGWLIAENEQTSALRQPTDTEQIGSENRQRRIPLLAASAGAAISWSGVHFLCPPLQLISIPITLAAALPILQDSVATYRTAKTGVAALSAVAVIGSVLLQQTTVAALIDVAYYTGEATLGWWKRRETIQTAVTDARSIYADTEVYIVRCWREDSHKGQSVMRYVLESSNDTNRQGFTELTDLIDALRSKTTAAQRMSTPVPMFAK